MNIDSETAISSRRLLQTGGRTVVLPILLGTSAVIAVGAIVAIYFHQDRTGPKIPRGAASSTRAKLMMILSLPTVVTSTAQIS